MELPVQVAEQVHRIMREELPELPDPDVHRAAAQVVRFVGLYSELFHRAACGAFQRALCGDPAESKTSDDELNALVLQYFPNSNQEK